MNVDKNRDYHSHLNNSHDECKKHMYYHVILTMTDGSYVDGIIEDVDWDSVSMLTGEDVMEDELENWDEMDTRQFYGGYGYPRRRLRRFRRRVVASRIIVGILIHDIALSFIVHYSRQLLNQKAIKWVSIIAGILLIRFSFYFGYEFILELQSMH
ncbi:hypothetical protein JMA_08580 [Jeotgalibacillus malaysiensis]|uniref:Uncharacterized protein n=1 Tax=Jeotgalibacillus malaysiensis TaxID=1508404 RepID=A0A0B5AIG0_9BACL|nr:hypothetical protein [Jeotgalibacillus malaysiensis]AJD90175.1 hypothetical protein JMA_08580 [Jeotgalibacillus malaysiensis]